jgi:putative ABC transport system permease protein
MVRHMGSVEEAAATKQLSETVRRTDRIDKAETGGIAVMAADPASPARSEPASGAASSSTPRPRTTRRSCSATTPPGRSASPPRGNRLAPRALVQRRQHPRPGDARPRPRQLGTDRIPGRGAAVRHRPLAHHDPRARRRRSVEQTRDLLAATANPEHPEEVEVSRPSDALAAEAAAKSAFNGLFLELGAVALLVGGVGLCPGGDWPPPLSHSS